MFNKLKNWFAQLPLLKRKTGETCVIWRCRRCKEQVDMVNKRCGCTYSPSPWEPFIVKK